MRTLDLSWLDEHERREAVARLDQYFAATSSKTAIAGIGVAEVGKTKLIRIGHAPWAAFATWRYARKLIARRWRWASSALFLPIIMLLWTPQGKAFIDTYMSYPLIMLSVGLVLYYSSRPVMRVPKPNGGVFPIRATTAHTAAVFADETGWRLLFQGKKVAIGVHGRDALRATALALPIINHEGGTQATIAEAIAMIEASGGPQQFIPETLSPAKIGATVQ